MRKVILLLSAAILMISVVSAQQVMREELIASEYGVFGDMFGVGDRLYKLTYDSGHTDYELRRATLFKPAFITSIPATLSVPIGGYIDVPITITGISSVTDGQSSHDHYIKVYLNDALVTERTYNVNSGKTFSAILQFGIGNVVGVYTYVVKETINLCPSTGCVVASGNNAYITVTVGIPIKQGYLKVDSIPSGADVRISLQGGSFSHIGMTPITGIVPRDAGSYTLEISKSGYQTYTTQFIIEGDKTTSLGTIYLIIQPTQTTPSLTQTTTPPTQTANCADGTANLVCSGQKPLYCYYGTLIDKASLCGCPTGLTASGDKCTVVQTPTPTLGVACGDGTLNGQCSAQKPLYCSGGVLIEKASVCGCPSGMERVSGAEGCVKPIDGFSAVFALVGLTIVAYIVLRRRGRE